MQFHQIEGSVSTLPTTDYSKLSCLFEWLSLSELKTCRLVCHGWMKEAESTFKARTRPSFNFNRFIHLPMEVYMHHSPQNINNYFKSFRRDGLPVNALELMNGTVHWQATTELKKFFENEGSQILDLRLKQIFLQDNHKNVRTCNTPLLLGVDMMRNIKRLYIDGKNPKTKFDVPLTLLENIEELSLGGCIVVISRKKIRPTKLELFGNFFLSPKREPLKKILLNTFVDFNKVNHLYIAAPSHRENSEGFPQVDIEIDMTTRHRLKFVNVYDVTVLNWEKVNWQIDVLFIKFRQIKLTKLRNFMLNAPEIQLKASKDAKVDSIRCLPPSVQRLSFDSLNSRDEFNFDPCHQFPNLTCLQIGIHRLSWLKILKNCPKLRYLEITEFPDDEILTGDLIPLSVKNIKLHRKVKLCTTNSEGVEFPVRFFERFVLVAPDLSYIREVLSIWIPEILILPSPSSHYDTAAIGIILEYLLKLPERITLKKKILVGCIDWKDEFENSKFSSILNAKSECYYFRNGRGSAILKKFENLANFGLSDRSFYIT